MCLASKCKNGAERRGARFGAPRNSLKQRPKPRNCCVVMVLVNLPPLLAAALRLGEGLAEPEWHCKRTAQGLVLNIRWKHQAAAPAPEKPCSPASPARRLNSRQRRSKRRLEEFLEKKRISNSKASEVVARPIIDEQLNANPAGRNSTSISTSVCTPGSGFSETSKNNMTNRASREQPVMENDDVVQRHDVKHTDTERFFFSKPLLPTLYHSTDAHKYLQF